MPDQSRRLYQAPSRLPPEEAARALAALQKRVAQRDFAGAVDLGQGYTIEGLAGTCHPLRDSYLCVEYVAPPSSSRGAFDQVSARVTVYRRPTFEPEVVWRLADHWATARPKGLTDAELDRREIALRIHRESIVRHFRELGAPDGTWGSGVPYANYYLRDGLLTVVLLDGWEGSPALSQPGAEQQISFEQWLQK